MKIMFLDESGDHSLDKIDSSYPVFVLAGCIFEKDYYEQTVVPGFGKLKEKFFGSASIILHTAEMIRPLKYKGKSFLKLIDKNFRNSFYEELNKFLESLNFAITTCAIKKQEHKEKYGDIGLDPYLFSFDDLLNRFIFQLQKGEQGIIIAENRNSVLDNQLELAWLNAKISGTKLVKSSKVKEKIDELKIIGKSKNEAGLQIADLIASPIGRKILGIKSKPGNEVNFSVIGKKCGLNIFP